MGMHLNRIALPCTLALCCVVIGCQAGKDDDSYQSPGGTTGDGDGTAATGATGGNGGTGGGQGGDGDTGNGGGGPGGNGGGDGDGDGVIDPNDPFSPATVGGEGRNNVVAGELCDRLTTIQCAGEALCCDNPGRDYNTCKSVMLAGCTSELHLDAIAMQSKTGFDPTHAAEAFTQFEMMASECDPNVASWGASLDGLAGMLKGTALEGSSCSPDGLPNPTTVQAASALASCRSPSTHACLPADVTITPIPRAMSRCNPHSGNGAVCYSDANCQPGLFCDNPDYENVLTAECKPLLANGTSCSQGNRCQSLICKGGRCVAADKQTAYCLAN